MANRMNSRGVSCVVAAILGTGAGAQTNLDLKNQTKNVDFSGAASTRVWKTGASLPATCNVGEAFFLTGTGPNVYICSTADVWTPVGNGTAAPGLNLGTNFPSDGIPVIDGSGTAVSSGCTASSGAMTCAGGFSSGGGATRITASEGSPAQAPAAGQQTLYIDSGDHSLKSVDNKSAVRTYSTLNGQESLVNKTFMNPSLGSTALSSSITNEGSTGTITNMLAKLTGNPAAAVLTATTDITGAVGVVISGAGTSGSASIAIAGQANCVFDGPTAAGDYVTISSTTAGACHDSGLNYPVGSQVVGRVLSTNNVAGIYAMNVFGNEVRGASASTESSFDPLDTTVAWWRDEMITNNQWYVQASASSPLTLGDYFSGDVNHPGIFNLNTSTAIGDMTEIRLSWSNSGENSHFPGGQVWDMRWVVKPASIAGARYEFGFGEHTGQSRLALIYDSAMGPDWQGDSIIANVDNAIDLGTPASTGWFTLRLRSDGTKVYFSVNQGTEKSICASGCDLAASLPFGALSQAFPFASVTNKSTIGSTIGIDFFALQISGLTR